MSILDVPGAVTESVVLGLEALTNCVCTELAASGAGPTCWCRSCTGAVVSWEYCGECSGGACGMGYVRMAGVFPFSTFPILEVDLRCTLPLAWTIEVGALRCVPQPVNGELLAAPQMADVAIEQILDAGALHRAIKCCGLSVAVESYTPVGPTGGCVGGFWRAHLALD